jgi:hypothetical protein
VMSDKKDERVISNKKDERVISNKKDERDRGVGDESDKREE